MIIAVIFLILVIVWALSVVAAFLVGFHSKGKEKTPPTPKEPTQAEKKEIEKIRKEYENFMAYDGTPQDAISGE